MIEPGIYIGTDLELVCTEGYLIAFRRNREANFLESRLLKRTDNMVSCIGVCQSSPAEVEQFRPPRCWRTAFIYDDKISASCQIFQQGQELRYDRPPIYQTFPDAQIGAYLGSSPHLSIKDGMVLAEFGDGVLYSAVLDEVLTEDSFCPTQNPTASAERIGECLQGVWDSRMKWQRSTGSQRLWALRSIQRGICIFFKSRRIRSIAGQRAMLHRTKGWYSTKTFGSVLKPI